MIAQKDVGKFFIRNDVQKILKQLTGCDLKKIFEAKFNVNLKNPKIELLSAEELDLYNQKAMKKAKYLLHMPPILKAREPCDKIIVEDPDLKMFNTTNTKYMFIDISMNVPDRKRKIVVRESNGNLRQASWEEREKMLQIYYTDPHKSFKKPEMFNQIVLEERLKEKKYLQILNEACLQYEPDDPEFIRVTHRTYEVINVNSEYEILKSTRFYGPMVFYLTWFKKLDNLIAYYLNNMNLEDAVNLARLFYIVHPEAKSSSSISKTASDIEILRTLINNELVENVKSELAFRNYLETNKVEKTASN